MCRYDKYRFRSLCLIQRAKRQILEGCYACKDFSSCNADWFVSGGFNLESIFRIRLFFNRRIQAVVQWGRIQFYCFCLYGGVCSELLQRSLRNAGVGDGDGCTLNGDSRDFGCNINLQLPLIGSILLLFQFYGAHIIKYLAETLLLL